MARRRRTPDHDQDGVTFQASLEGANCIKFDGSGQAVRFTVPDSDTDALAKLAREYREQPLIVVVMKQRDVR
jgi:hypothetical protein